MYVIEFDYRDDGGPTLIGPFATKPGAQRWVDVNGPATGSWNFRPLSVPDHQ